MEYINEHYGTDGLLNIIDIDVNILGDILMLPNFSEFLYDVIPNVFKPLYDGATIERHLMFDYLNTISKVLFFKKMNEHRNNIALLQRQNWNSQTLVLQQVLRDLFKSHDIFVENIQNEIRQRYLFKNNETASQDEQIYLYNDTEIIDETDNTYLYSQQELFANYDVIIRVPVVLESQNRIIHDTVGMYVTPVTRYGITYF